MNAVYASMPKIEYRAFAGYGLTPYFIIYVVGLILRKNTLTSGFVKDPSSLLGSNKEEVFYKCLSDLLVTLIIDLNYEVKGKGDSFDYKSDLKSPRQTQEWSDKLIQSYEKDVARGKAEDFAQLN